MKKFRRALLRTILLPFLPLLLAGCGGVNNEAGQALAEDLASSCPASSRRQASAGGSCVNDQFQQPPASVTSKVDILFVMDNSRGMHRHWRLMARQIDKLVRELPANEDIRFGVIIGSIEKNTGTLFSAPSVAKVLDGTQMSATQVSAALQATFAEALKDKNVDRTGAGKASIYSTYYAVTRDAKANQKLGFFRPDAALNLIFMSDAADESHPYPTKQFWDLPGRCNWGHHEKVRRLYHLPRGIGVDSTFAAIRRLKGDMPVLTNAFVNVTREDILADDKLSANCIFGTPGLGYFEMVRKTGGVLYSIHAGMDEGLKLNGRLLRARLGLIHGFALSKPANLVDPASIVTKVGGTVVGHVYEASTNMVHLEQAGSPGSVVEIHHCGLEAQLSRDPADFSGSTTVNTAVLSWNTFGSPTEGKVVYGTSAQELNDTVAEAQSGYAHAVEVSGLAPDTAYYFQAVAKDSFGTEKKSEVISLRTKPSWALSALTGQASRNSASVSWSSSSYPTAGHVIWGKSPSELVNVTDETIPSKDHTVLITGLEPNASYYFQAVSRDEFGVEKRTQVRRLKAIAGWTIIGFSGSATRDSASLFWQTPGDATAGKLYYGLSPDSLNSSVDSAALGNEHSVTVDGLSAGTKYYFRAVSSDELGAVKFGKIITLTTAPDWTLGSVETDSSETTFTVAFKTEGYPAQGRVFWGTSANLLSNELGAGAQEDHLAAVTGLAPDTDYFVQASAFDGLGVEKRSEVIAVHTKAAPLSRWAVTDFGGVSAVGSVFLNWKAPGYASNGIVRFGKSPGSLTGSVAECGSATDHELEADGLDPDTLYYFQVVAKDNKGQEQASPVVAIRTQSLPLPVWDIAAFAGTSAQGSVTVSWSTVAHPTLGKVRWGTSPTNLDQETEIDASGKFHLFTVENLEGSAVYYFQAVASDDRGQRKESPVIAVTDSNGI